MDSINLSAAGVMGALGLSVLISTKGVPDLPDLNKLIPASTETLDAQTSLRQARIDYSHKVADELIKHPRYKNIENIETSFDTSTVYKPSTLVHLELTTGFSCDVDLLQDAPDNFLVERWNQELLPRTADLIVSKCM
jgi:hypothetical protein